MGRNRAGRDKGRTIPLGWSDADADADASADADHSDFPPRRSASDPEPSAVSTETAAPVGESRPRHRLIAIISAVAVVAAMIVILPLVFDQGRSPQDAARAYLDAVVDGDADAIRELLAPSGEGAQSIAITDEILAATPDRISSYSIGEVTMVDGEPVIGVTLRNGEQAIDGALRLTQAPSGRFSRSQWEVEPVELPQVTLALPAATNQIVVNGVSVRIKRPLLQLFGTEVNLSLVPGTYEVTLPEQGELLTPVPREVRVPPVLASYQNPRTDLTASLTEAGQEETQRLFAARLEDCASSTSSRPLECPFSTGPDDGPVLEGTWEIVATPEFEDVTGYPGMQGVGGEGGIAAFTHTVPDPDGGPGREITDTVHFTTGGWVQPRGDGTIAVSLLVTSPETIEICPGDELPTGEEIAEMLGEEYVGSAVIVIQETGSPGCS